MTGPKQTFFFLTFCTTTTITGFSQPAALSVSWPFLTNHFFFRYFSSLHRPSLTQIKEHIFFTRDSAPASVVIFDGTRVSSPLPCSEMSSSLHYAARGKLGAIPVSLRDFLVLQKRVRSELKCTYPGYPGQTFQTVMC